MQGMWELLPVDEVSTDRMPPCHVAPINAEWVVLKEEMILAFIVNQTVRIVGPVGFGCEVELRTIRFFISRLDH